jgi:hypothetical protein
MRKDEAVGNKKKKMQVCLPKNNYKLHNNLLTVEPRAVDPPPNPDPAHNLDADPDPDPAPDPRGGGGGQPKMCIPPVKILSTPLAVP